jgi:hypothetical protein
MRLDKGSVEAQIQYFPQRLAFADVFLVQHGAIW